jgi:hypothetical protein
MWPQTAQSLDDPAFMFAEKEKTLSLDGFPSAVYSEPTSCGNELMATSTAGTLWYASWTEMATIKIKACHSPNQSMNFCEFKYLPPS